MKIFKRLILWSVMTVFLWIGIQTTSYYYWIWRGWNDSNLSSDINKHMEKFSSDELFKKIKGINLTIVNPYRDGAWRVLIDRKDRRIVPILIKELKSWNKDTRVGAIRVLGDIGDERAMKPFMEIVRNARIDYSYDIKTPTPDYIVALQALAKMKYEPIYHYAVEFATSKDKPNNLKNYGVMMLGDFKKSEALPILRKIAEEEKDLPWIEQTNFKNAIQSIESAQEIKQKE